MRFSLILLLLIFLLTVFAAHIAPYQPARTSPQDALQPPSLAHLLGTDLLGRDVFSRVLYGGQRTLRIAGVATMLAVCVGGLLGIVASLGQPIVDRMIRIGLDALLAIPDLVLALAIITMAGRGDWQLALAVGIAQVARYAMLVRAVIIGILAAGYIDAARALGGSQRHILVYHMLPNVSGTLLTYAGVLFSYAIISVGALGFLGLSGDPGSPDWGVILAEGRFVLRTAPWVSIAPGVMIVCTVLSINTLIDYLTRQ